MFFQETDLAIRESKEAYMKIGFSNEKYLEMQSNMIKERINEFGGKLYLEFGGKLFDDYHASRVPVFRRCTRNVPEFCSTRISDISTLTPEQPSGPMISSHEAIRQSA